MSNDTRTLTLTEFLLARIAEDEAGNDRAVTSEVERCQADGMPDLTEQEVRDYWADQAWWRRRLAECETKRRIVELAWHHFGDDDFAGGMEYAKEQVLELMSTVYADHPDYRDEWRP
jgi:hypothetical protein